MMPYANIVKLARRGALHGVTLEALDLVESIYRGLDEMAPDQIDMEREMFNELRQKMQSAYDALARARQITETDGTT